VSAALSISTTIFELLDAEAAASISWFVVRFGGGHLGRARNVPSYIFLLHLQHLSERASSIAKIRSILLPTKLAENFLRSALAIVQLPDRIYSCFLRGALTLGLLQFVFRLFHPLLGGFQSFFSGF